MINMVYTRNIVSDTIKQNEDFKTIFRTYKKYIVY